jgi:microsomal epoxide hydrolase
VFERDHLLANISLYWFTGAIGSSFWPYYARMHGPVAGAGRRGRRADGIRRVPARDPAPAALGRRARLHRHPALDDDAARRSLRGDGAAEALADEIVEFFRPLRAAPAVGA